MSGAEMLIKDLSLIMVLGAIVTIIFKKVKQPVVLGYIVAGFFASSHFSLLPTVTNPENIEFWAQIGIVVLLFNLGLEFSFKKLLNVGGSAVVTALIIVGGMMLLGFATGHVIGLSTIDSIFLGGMLSMSSTTIIIKAFTDLNMRQQKFASLVFAVLICEDLFAVLLMVILSSIAINKSVGGEEMLISVLKLSFFLVMWFVGGVFLIPPFFKRVKKMLSQEMLLIVSMGLCLGMAIFSLKCGFSMALGAFVMGSILAGTSMAERIEHVVSPVKDFFGAVFFISVGMMVNPIVIMENAGIIALLSIVVIVGMIVFGTMGMLITGQPLKVAMQSGFSLTQIGEFSFIIATLGMSLGVLDKTIYPIVVAVSVITTFFTPYFMQAANPCYAYVARRMPKRLSWLLTSYSSEQTTVSASSELKRSIVKYYATRILIYSAVILTIFLTSGYMVYPTMIDLFGETIGAVIVFTCTIACVLPFMYAMVIVPKGKREEIRQMLEKANMHYSVTKVLMEFITIVVASALMLAYLAFYFTHVIVAFVVLLLIAIVIALLTRKYHRHMHNLEKMFVSNFNERELRRSGKENVLVSDLHMAYIRVGYGSPFVGERLKNSQIRAQYGVNVASIIRMGVTYPVPTGDMRIFPNDQIGVIGTDEQIRTILPLIENDEMKVTANHEEVSFVKIEIGPHSVLCNHRVDSVGLREKYRTLLVAIGRGDEIIKPTGKDVFQAGDVLWLVGNKQRLQVLN